MVRKIKGISNVREITAVGPDGYPGTEPIEAEDGWEWPTAPLRAEDPDGSLRFCGKACRDEARSGARLRCPGDELNRCSRCGFEVDERTALPLRGDPIAPWAMVRRTDVDGVFEVLRSTNLRWYRMTVVEMTFASWIVRMRAAVAGFDVVTGGAL